MKEGGYLPPEMTAGIDNTVNSDVYKNMGTAEKAQFWSDVKGYTGSALGQYYKMQQLEAEQKGLYDRAKAAQKPPMSSNPDEVFGSIFSGTPVAPKTPAAVVPVDQSGQDTTQPATDLAGFIRRRLGYIPSVIPPALMAEWNALTGQ